MADAWSILNHGNLLNFVTPNTEDLEYCANGIYLTDTFTAKIGLELKTGEQLSFQVDNGYFKNSTISETGGIQGDPVTVPDSTALQTMAQYYMDTDDCSKSYVLGDNFRPALDHQILIAGHLKFDNGWGDTYTVGVTWDYYDGTSQQFVSIPQNYNGNYMHTQDMGSYPPYLVMEYCFNASKTNYEPQLNYFYQAIGHPLANAYIRNALLSTYRYATSLATNIPIFDTMEHARAYLQDNTQLDGLLNGGSDVDPEEEYKKEFDFWYIRGVVGHNTRNSQASGLTSWNFRFKPKSNEKICFLKLKATENSPYTLQLKNYSTYNAYTAGRGVVDDDEYNLTTNIPQYYLDRSISWGDPSNYWTKFEWESNIPRFDTEQQCEDYFNGIIDISSASNYAEIARIDNEIIQSDWAGLERDELTSLGTNGMQYGYGLRLYAMTNIELASLFNELFDPANINDILDGTKLYGSASDCVAGIMYLPLNDLSAICNLGSTAKVWIGSWQAEHAEGKRIINNTGLIDCGSFTMTPSYCDFRDFEPYTLLFVMLPFIGFKQLTLSKYLSQSTPKTISVKYAIDVSTGGCCAMLLADGKLMDLFEGTCGASRPFSAIDNNGYVNQCISAITGASNSASGSVSGVANAVTDAGKMAAKSGSAMGVLGVGGVAVAGAGTAISGIYQGYQIKQAVDNPPIMQRGNLTGNLSYYTVDKVTFLTAKKRTIRPENELNVIGYPSGHGGTVGQFSGFLKCSAFMMADGFIGSEAERAMILDEMEKGVYI